MNYLPIMPKQALIDSMEILAMAVGHGFSETFGTDVVSGRDFSTDFPTDSTDAFLINETAAHKLGWDDPVGQELTLGYFYRGRIMKPGRVVGVIEDFHYNSLHHAIDPLILHILPAATQYYNYLSVRIRPDNIRETLGFMAEQWARFNPERPFEYMFLDEEFEVLYRAEEQLGQLFITFSIMAVFIACLGLFGLASFSAERRTKEIGVRKVLGATVADIVLLLSKDFARLALVAFVIASPVAYLVMHQWLSNFAYRVEIGLDTFLWVGLLALGIALLTVSYQSIKAAIADPVEALKYE